MTDFLGILRVVLEASWEYLEACAPVPPEGLDNLLALFVWVCPVLVLSALWQSGLLRLPRPELPGRRGWPRQRLRFLLGHHLLTKIEL